MREEILELETNIRQKRDQVADMEARQTRENYLRQREDEIESTRNQLENKALTLLSEDLSDQLSGLYENA